MELAFSIAHDFEIFDNRETVTLYRGTNSMTGEVSVSKQVSDALRTPLSRQQAALLEASIGLQPDDTSFSLPACQLADFVPAAGDVLEDAAGVRWTVQSASQETLQSRWSLTCRKER